MKPQDISSVEQRLGYTFNNETLLVRALTRKAFALEPKQQGKNRADQGTYPIPGVAILQAI